MKKKNMRNTVLLLNSYAIACIMAQKRLSQSSLAKSMSTSVSTVHNALKKGFCLPITAGKMADALGVSLPEIILGEEHYGK